MSLKPGARYVVNNELTEDALLTTEVIKSSTFNVGSAVPVRINEDESGQRQASGPKRMNYQKFINITYPNGDKSASVIIPNCVMHHAIHDYYGKSSIYMGIPQEFVRQLSLKLSVAGHTPLFQDKKILSDSSYWWTRASFKPAEDGKEYIRVVDEEGAEEFYGSFADLFADFPTSMIANVTGTLKLKTDVGENEALSGKETWRGGFLASMFTPIDAIEVAAPSTGIGQRSMAGTKDKAKSGLLKKRVAQP